MLEGFVNGKAIYIYIYIIYIYIIYINIYEYINYRC